MANPAYIQSAISANPSSSSAVSIAATYSTANLTAGSVLWCYCTWGTTDATPTCSDGTNGAWTAGPKAWDSAAGQGFAMFYFKNSAGGVKPTVTVSFGTSRDWIGIHIFEIGPADTVTQPDGTAPAPNLQANPGTGANVLTSGNIATNDNNALIVGASINLNGIHQPTAGTSPLTFNSRSGWTASLASCAEDAILATSGTTTAKFTAVDGTDDYLTGVMAFKAVAAGGGLTQACSATQAALWADATAQRTASLLAISDSDTAWNDTTAQAGASAFSTSDSDTAWNDALSAVIGGRQAVADNTSWSDALTAVVGKQQTVSDSAAWSDATTFLTSSTLGVSDSLATWNDSVSAFSSSLLSTSDAFAFSDALMAFANSSLVIADGQSWADALAEQLGMQAALSDAQSWSDAVSLFSAQTLILSDTQTWNDVFDSATSSYLAIADAAAFDDAFTASMLLSFGVSDSTAANWGDVTFQQSSVLLGVSDSLESTAGIGGGSFTFIS